MLSKGIDEISHLPPESGNGDEGQGRRQACIEQKLKGVQVSQRQFECRSDGGPGQYRGNGE